MEEAEGQDWEEDRDQDCHLEDIEGAISVEGQRQMEDNLEN